MKSYAKTILLKNDPEKIAEYRRHHDHIWSEVVASFRKVGVLDMRIWLIGNRLFMVMDTEDDFDPDTSLEKYVQLDPRNDQWENLMASYQEPVPEARPGEHWADLELVFRMNDH
jgi:L-rhamnose mutarotase